MTKQNTPGPCLPLKRQMMQMGSFRSCKDAVICLLHMVDESEKRNGKRGPKPRRLVESEEEMSSAAEKEGQGGEDDDKVDWGRAGQDSDSCKRRGKASAITCFITSLSVSSVFPII